MRLIVRYCQPWGNFTTHSIDSEANETLYQLKQKISQKFNISIESQILKLKRKQDHDEILIGDNTLQQLDLTEKSVILVENEDDSFLLAKRDDSNVTSRYFERLKLMQPQKAEIIQEEEEEEEEVIQELETEYQNERRSLIQGVTYCLLKYNYEEEASEKENMNSYISQLSVPSIQKKKRSGASKSTIIKKQLEEIIEKLIKAAKIGEISQFLSILKEEEDKIQDDFIFNSEFTKDEIAIYHEINKKRKSLFDEIGNSGRNSVHQATYHNQNHILILCIEKECNLNILTHDGWNLLTLAIHINNIDGLKLLLKSPGIDINQLSSQGTALHLAAKQGKLGYVELLLANKAKIDILNEEGQTPIDVASREEIKNILQSSNKLFNIKIDYFGKPTIENSKSEKNQQEQPPKKLPIIMSTVYKKGSIFKARQRFLVLNSDDGTLIRFKEKKNYPLKPKEIIPLKDIQQITQLNPQGRMKKDYYYFEYTYKRKQIYGCKTKEIANTWITYLKQAAEYAKYIEKLYTQLSLQEQIDQVVNKKVVEIINLDEQKKEDEIDRSIKNGKDKKIKNMQSEQKVESKPQNEKIVQEEEQQGISEFPSDEKITLKSFDIVKVLGSGAFGKVYKVRKKDTDEIFAMKALKKKNLILKKQLKYAITECNVLKNAKFPFILGLNYSFQTPSYLYLVLDYCPGGDLSFHIAQKITFDEEEAKFYIAELILAIEHLHSMDIIYRDLKPENILIGMDGHIKLADFGLSKEGVQDDVNAKSFCGSPAYLSPEMLKNKGAGKAADIYGIGAVLYEMLAGQPPYFANDITSIYANINKGKLDFPNYVSNVAQEFIWKLLNKDPNSRIGVKDKNQLKNDPFFHGIDWNKLARKEYKPPLLTFLEDEEDELQMDGNMVFHDRDYTEKNQDFNRVTNFTFVKKDQLQATLC